MFYALTNTRLSPYGTWWSKRLTSKNLERLSTQVLYFLGLDRFYRDAMIDWLFSREPHYHAHRNTNERRRLRSRNLHSMPNWMSTSTSNRHEEAKPRKYRNCLDCQKRRTRSFNSYQSRSVSNTQYHNFKTNSWTPSTHRLPTAQCVVGDFGPSPSI